MPAIEPKKLVGKLNDVCLKALSQAANLCKVNTNYAVEVEHFLAKLLENAETDLAVMVKHYDVNPSVAAKQLGGAIERFKRGNNREHTISPDVLKLLTEAGTLAALEYGHPRIRSGHIVVAVMTEPSLKQVISTSCPELAKIAAKPIQTEARVLMTDTPEDQYEVPVTGDTVAAAGGGQVAAGSKTPNLDQFTQNLTARAKKGEIDPVVGRDAEIRQVIDILTRRRQNNPILAGEAGVGKTAVVEGFALRIVSGDVPDPLKNCDVRVLDLGLMQAGAGVKGEFENRLKGVIAEVKSSPKPVILFIDEAHTLMGAGGEKGMGDAANLLKPALARGELRTVAATTWAEYKKSFETDPALKRRFQVVKVDEPDEGKAILMLRGIMDVLEKHHKVRILDEAVEDAVRLSHRYITDRQLPDKAVSLLDTVCARVGLSQSATPAALEDCRREIDHYNVERDALEKEQTAGMDHSQRLGEIADALAKAEARLKELEARLVEEKKLVEEIRQRREKLEKSAIAKKKPDSPDRLPPEEEEKLRKEMIEFKRALQKIQGEHPMVFPVVDRQAVAEVVSAWTGIPVGKMVLDEIKTILNLKDKLEERVVGQGHALDALAQRIKTSRAGLSDPRRPIGVFLLVGPSGTGKTETAIALSEILYGGDRNMIVINMSEYKEEHKISRLTGSAPGYVGYGEGGVLTEAVRRKPYSIVLLDEVEKAHQAVQEIFYQVFDKGMLQDDKGEEINFKNTIILLTANVASDTIMKLCADPDTMPNAQGLAEAIRPDLLKAFKPALLGRINVLPYFPLGDEVLKKIIKLKLNQIAARVKENHRATFEYDDKLVDAVASRCKEVETGARNVDHILTGTVLPEVSREVLARMAEGHAISHIKVTVGGDGNFAYTIE